ncbi:ABC transporter substrate-binding protein [Lichenihabitans psoromatis]|uniref:ABC transporter substrate-binding protein n=1 Tax=Lichenihabitans psoromatis TaxID=2528642 RepID=UPI00103857DA|nr:ABC transporter substrate-binding protein [Lichenihabitans psoromatis]
MQHVSRRTLLATALASLAGLAAPSVAIADGLPTQPVADFYNALMDSMRHARELKVKGRYDLLEPVMLKSFDVPVMVKMAVGREFTAMSADDQARLQTAFGKLLVASFASEFDDFKGEKFTIDDQTADRNEGKLVKSKFVGTGAPVDLNYLVRNTAGSWRIVDVYLNGTISQLATWRSKFGATLKTGGAPAMIQAVEQQTAKYMAAI